MSRKPGEWPIVQWMSKDGLKFCVEDDQGYNFSFDSRKTAEAYLAAAFEYQETIASREKDMVQRFKEELYS